jgi:uncharacterized protein YutE (UPF0331/DUF86 family)
VVDPARVRRLLESLRYFRDRLADLRNLPVDLYVGEHAFAGRYLVQAAAQACIDIASHIISSEGLRTPRDFRDAFSVLEENGVVTGDLAMRLRALAGLRNRLVHLYEDIDDVLVHESLTTGLSDLDEFARAVGQLVNDTEKE